MTSLENSDRNRRLQAAILALMGAALVTFLSFAALRDYYLFDADHAVQIIMARYFDGRSQDFYYWGQNRLGSLIPLLLILPIQVLKLPPLACAVGLSLAFYLGCLFLLLLHARGFAERFVCLAAFFLLPIGAYKYLLYTGHPYGPSLALMLAAFTVLFRPGGQSPSRVRYFAAGFLLSVGLWVSEATAAGIVAILWLLRERRRSLGVDRAKLGLFFLGLFWLLPFMLYWRFTIGFQGHDGDYVRPATPGMVLGGLQRFFPQFSDLVNSELSPKPVTALGVATALLGVNLVALFFRKGFVGEAPEAAGSPLVSFLAIHNLCYFLIVHGSRHSYFGAAQIQRFWVPVLMFSLFPIAVIPVRAWRRVAAVQSPGRGRVAVGGACLGALACFVGLARLAAQRFPYGDDSVHFRAIRAHRANLEALRARHVKQVMGDYWESLPLTVLSDFEILAVPYDFVRMERFRDTPGEFVELRTPRSRRAGEHP